MKNKKIYKYYIGIVQDFIDFDGYDSTDEFTSKFLKDIGIQYYIDESSYCDDFNYKEVLRKSKLSDIILTLMNDSVDEDSSEFEDIEDEIDLLYDLLSDKVILRYNNRTDKFNLVSEDTILNTYLTVRESMMYKIGEEVINNILNDLTRIDVKNFESSYAKLMDLIESKMESEFLMVTAICSGKYSFAICKEKSEVHSALVENNIVSKKIKGNKNGNIYEFPYSEFKNVVEYNLSNGDPIGITVRAPLSKFDKETNPNPMAKVYGIFVHVNENNEMFFEQFSANEVLKSYTTDANNGKEIPADKNTIYCGIDNDDIICGFDLV